MAPLATGAAASESLFDIAARPNAPEPIRFGYQVQDPAQVARGLEEIAALLAFAGEPKFRVKAYERAASLVDTLGNDLASVIERNGLQEIEGIGSALSSQIRALWDEGTSELLLLLLRLRREHPDGAAELVRVAGMTPRRIRALNAALDIRSVEDLRAACLAQRVRHVPGFGAKTETRLLAESEQWLGRASKPKLPLLRARALELAALLQHECARVAPRVEFAGSLRRGEDTVDALDLVVERRMEGGPAADRQIAPSRADGRARPHCPAQRGGAASDPSR